VDGSFVFCSWSFDSSCSGTAVITCLVSSSADSLTHQKRTQAQIKKGNNHGPAQVCSTVGAWARDFPGAAVGALTSARSLSLVVLLGVVAGCAPANPSEHTVVGRWKVEWTCGAQTLDLNASGNYDYHIDFATGGQVTDSGHWRMIAKTELLSGAQVVLENALETCSAFGEKIREPTRADRALETIWEWGRMILSFNPDVQGFTRLVP